MFYTSTPSIVRGAKMNVGAIVVFCCAIVFQATNAAPAVEVTATTDNPLIQNAAAGDLLLKTPEPLNPAAATVGASVSAGPGAVAAALNDSMDQVAQVGDHVLDGTASTAAILPNGKPSASLPTYSPGTFVTAAGSPGGYAAAAAAGSPGTFAATATGLPGASAIETTTSPFDGELATTSGPATTSGLPVADPMIFYRLFTNLLRQPEQFIQSIYPPFSGMPGAGFPSLRMPTFRSVMPSTNIGLNDPSLKLVDQKIIDDGTVKGQFNMYEGQPDPNTVTKMQTGQFSMNKDGMRGEGVGHYYTSSSASSSLGGNPGASVSSFFSGLPSRFNMAFPLRLT